MKRANITKKRLYRKRSLNYEMGQDKKEETIQKEKFKL